MSHKTALEETLTYVQLQMSGEGTGHDWFHVERVLKLALTIAEKESEVDMFVLQMVALLHDITDWKFTDDTNNTKEREWMQSLELDTDLIERICRDIQAISFKGGANPFKPTTIEAKIVQDADRLDALGAIGIGRTFAFGGFKDREMYNPDKKPQEFATHEEYKKHEGTTINHFYEKLFKIRDLMHTDTAKKIAKERETFMRTFLDEFYAEWNGER